MSLPGLRQEKIESKNVQQPALGGWWGADHTFGSIVSHTGSCWGRQCILPKLLSAGTVCTEQVWLMG